MRLLRGLILAAGFATLGLLLWRLSPSVVWARISLVGWGILPILAFQIFDHTLNALGWRFGFAPQDARRVPYWRLVKVRIAGDAVNYLTPSGQVAGELIRPAMLGDVCPDDVKNSSVLVAKFAQALAQAVFILVGLLFVGLNHMNFLEGRELALSIGGALLVIALISLAIYATSAETGFWAGLFSQRPVIAAMRDRMRSYLRRHPARFLLSTLCFTLGYAWGMLEVMLICYFMKVEITPIKALAVETLSNVIDSLMFMVPAKVGTQEAGKAAIFKAIGYPAATGLALGIIRHVRELTWNCCGFLVYALSRARGQAPRPTLDLVSEEFGGRPGSKEPPAR